MNDVGQLASVRSGTDSHNLAERMSYMAYGWAHDSALQAVKTAAAVRVGKQLVHTDPQFFEELVKTASRRAIGTAAKDYAKRLADSMGREGAEAMGAGGTEVGSMTSNLLKKMRGAIAGEPAGAAAGGASKVLNKSQQQAQSMAKMLDEGAAKLEAAGDSVNPSVFRDIAAKARKGELPDHVVQSNLEKMPGIIKSRHTGVTGGTTGGTVGGVPKAKGPIPSTQQGISGTTPSMAEGATLAAPVPVRAQTPAVGAAPVAGAGAAPARSSGFLPAAAIAGGTGVATGTTAGVLASRRPAPKPSIVPRPMPGARPNALPPVAWGAAQLPKAASGRLIPKEKAAGIGTAIMKGMGKIVAAPTVAAAKGAKLMGAGKAGQVAAGAVGAAGTAAVIGGAGVGTVKGVQHATKRHRQFQHQPYRWGRGSHQPYWRSSQM